jgi:hypothetical protein
MKIVTSPVTKFPGTVTLKEPLPLDACVMWEAAIQDCKARPCQKGLSIISEINKLQKDESEKMQEIIDNYNAHFFACIDSKEHPHCRPAKTDIEAQVRMLQVVKPCVAEWKIEGFDLANPPGSPKAARSELIGWLITEISKIYIGDDPAGDPNV